MNLTAAHKKRNLLVFRSDLLPQSETFVKEQVLALRRWDPTLIGLRYVKGLDLEGLKCSLLSGWLPGGLPRKLMSRLRELELAPPGMRGQLQSLRPELIHVHFATDLVAAWPLLSSGRVPILTTLHGYDINVNKDHWLKGNRANRHYPDRLLAISKRQGVGFVAVSNAIRDRAIDYGIDPTKIWVKYIGVDLQRFTPGNAPMYRRRKRILFVGRMVEKKGASILVRAFAEVKLRVPDAELIMIGDGPLFDQNVRLARTMNVPVNFMGSSSSATVRSQMDEARVVCLPSITAADGDAEGLPMVVIEAQASGLPVVTSARGGATEGIIDGVTGFAFAEGDVAALVRHLVMVLTDDDLCAAMSRSGREFVASKFDLRNCSDQLETLYDSLTPAEIHNVRQA